MTALDTVAAWPVGANANKALQRTAVTKRFIWVFSDSEDTQNFDVVDPADGTLPLYIQWKGILFQYDSTDTTTAHDGTTCAVTHDEKRYKAVAAIPTPYSVLSTTTTAQPTSPAPTIGDTYYIPSAATGTDWSGKDGQIGIYLARGWVFQAVRIGQFVYDESSDTYYHKTAAGTLTAGFGSQSLGAGQVLPSNMSGGGAKIRWFVENQTTNTPPSSPPANVEYIVGPSPTGTWSGRTAQIARYESGVWVFYAPAAGWLAYDKSLGYDVQYTGTSWQALAGAVVAISRPSSGFTRTSGATTRLVPPGGDYTYSTSSSPTTNHNRLRDDITVTHTVKGPNRLLRIRYTALALFTASSSHTWTIALFVVGQTNAIHWLQTSDTQTGTRLDMEFYYQVAAQGTYEFQVCGMRFSSGNEFASLSQREFIVEELAAGVS